MTLELPRDDTFTRDVRSRLVELAGTLTATLRPSAVALAANPGKCLRSHLLEVCSRLGPANRDRVVRLGTLVELLHIATLLHDDVVDRTAVRRGRPTAHAVAGHEHAVLTGTALLAVVGQEAADLGDAVSRHFAATAAELAHGELLDVERAYDIDFDTHSYLALVRHKTSALFRLACVLGAGEAGALEDTVVAVAAFGSELGAAFQIADDCLDLRAEPGDKPVGTDHLLGLFGLPTLCALRRGDDRLRDLLLAPDLGIAHLPAIRERVLAGGGVDEAMAVAEQLYRDAVSALGDLAGTAPGAALMATGEALWRQWR